MTNQPKYSLKTKLTILIVVMIVVIIMLASLLSYRNITDINETMYIDRAEELSSTAATLVDPQQVKTIRDEVMAIFNATEDKVSTDDWGSPEFDAYLENYAAIIETEEYQTIQSQLRTIQDANNLQAVYIICFDLETESTIYLVDASYEEYCPPGCFDSIMYDVDKEAALHPEIGIAADVTNTPEYGWLVAAGSPIFMNDELIAFAGADISMNRVMAQRNQFLLQALIALIVLAVAFIVLSVVVIDRMIIRPINKLSDTSEKYWSGETSAIRHDFSELQINTGDELEVLSNSMKQMEENINEHLAKILETTEALRTTRRHAEEMDRAANIDALTKVRNKRAYDLEIERINRDIKEGNTAYGLAMIDLNFLKKTNDTYGHEKGDIAIKNLCQTICRVFLHSPVFRIGGDEFVVVLANHDYENLDDLKEQFESEILKCQSGENPWDRISAAAGYALFDPEIDNDMESVFKRADQRMYERKNQMKAARA